ncbi:hypothetical protein [Nocardioides cavernaquae]|uniref:Lipoprotein n=1 Tax=Nocardioides cavernaquae TaxID=2321396 RepID=A0A3A5HDA5_9ACTN|nr:hypothetical protein [Nocardioides cavernaquae]RJS45957.1 hypothetical protein D4739_06770 [Nocardioides cavernaquae]
MRLSVALAVSTVLPFAVACSSYADTSAKQVEKDVKAAMSGLKSVHLGGEVEQDGTKLELDLSLNTDGDCTGSIGLGTMGKLDLIRVDGASFVRPDEAFWTASGAGAVAKAAKGKWIGGEDAFGGMAGQICDLDGMLDDINSDDDSYGKVSEAEPIDGKDVVKVAFTTTDDSKGTLYVLSDDPHYVVKADVGDEGSITFSEFDEPVEPKAPAKNQVIDASKLG